MNNILIYGPPASGKTFFGRKLAEAFKVQFIDLDEEIVSRTNDSIEEIISIIGENGFRRVEADILEDLVFTYNNAIISLGGGALLNNELRKIVEAENTVICLNVDQATLEKNYLNDKTKRPLCNSDINSYRKLLSDRKDHYLSFDYQLTSMVIDPSINEENGLSNIFIGNIFDKAISNLIKVLYKNSKISIIFDRNVSDIANKIKKNFDSNFSGLFYKIDATEKNKTIKTVNKIIDKFDQYNLNRNDIVISIGGGITSDITGFATSIWKRGIRWINIPTTLLSIVDASIGGKTGVNNNSAKNIIGTFHKPSSIFIDCNLLKTLDKNEFCNGYAEAYKHYLIDLFLNNTFNDNIVDVLKALPNISLTNQKNIAKFINTKIKIVTKDPFEKNGERIKLNLGHTIAHAIEIKTNYKISHGNAVAIGICEELRLAKAKKILKSDFLLEQVINDFKRLGLPTELPNDIKFKDLENIMYKDKKNCTQAIKFILLEDIGKTIEFFM